MILGGGVIAIAHGVTADCAHGAIRPFLSVVLRSLSGDVDTAVGHLVSTGFVGMEQ